ncbi:unnamed protein product [Adineta steineri]|uniref:Uncharacterized protein n=1 Tax=Adineta steineri TaxID=433720 RepID=A0A814EP60_9BILA|nr:unnamed protein product [Adineta steineri]CAF1037535.1 unnamed protein product [Adineta steineri]
MKVDASQPLSIMDGNNPFTIEQDQQTKKSYFKDLRQSFNLTYLTHKWFDEKYWKLVFCSSSYDCINKYPNIFLIYRTLLFVLTIIDLIYGIVIARPVQEWIIYFTHLTLLITFLAIIFQFLITYRVNFYRGNQIVPQHYVQYIHIILILISLSSGLVVCLIFWIFLYNPVVRLYSSLILDHGIIWLLFFIDIFLLTRLPIYMIDCIPLIIFVFLYGLFTFIIFIFKFQFSRNRIGYVYRAFDFNNSPLRVTIQAILFIFFLPVLIMFILWNLFRLRRAIDVKITNEREESAGNMMA